MINLDLYVDELAGVIRKVDGKHELGAGALAEKIIEDGFLERVVEDVEADRIARREF